MDSLDLFGNICSNLGNKPIVAFVDKAPKFNKADNKQHYFGGSTLVPYLKIYPNYLVQYYQRDNASYSERATYWSDEQKERIKANLAANGSDGSMSLKSSKAIRIAINWLEHLSKKQKVWCEELKKDVAFKINFLTLTLPCPQVEAFIDNYGNEVLIDNCEPYTSQVNNGNGIFVMKYSDNYIKAELLNHFLTILRRDYKVDNYIWRAETQKNGNIHFHITTNKFIYLQDLRKEWNKVLAKTDMISRYKQRFEKMSFEQYKAYRRKYGNPKLSDMARAYDYGCKTNWLDPNTTDIHAVWKIKNIAAYLCEYMSKNNSAYRKLEGFLWRSSNLLAKLKGECIILSGKCDDEIRHLYEYYKTRIYQTDYASIFKFTIKDLKFMLKSSELVKRFDSYVNAVFLDYYKNVKYNL